MPIESKPVNSQSPTILVIDDDDQVRMLLKRVLVYSNFNVIEAATGEEAVTMARQQLPDAIVCDFRLPGMNGIELVERLRFGPATFDIPVVLVSGKGGDLNGAAAPLHRTVFLPKPFLMSDLTDLIRKALAESNVPAK